MGCIANKEAPIDSFKWTGGATLGDGVSVVPLTVSEQDKQKILEVISVHYEQNDPLFHYQVEHKYPNKGAQERKDYAEYKAKWDFNFHLTFGLVLLYKEQEDILGVCCVMPDGQIKNGVAETPARTFDTVKKCGKPPFTDKAKYGEEIAEKVKLTAPIFKKSHNKHAKDDHFAITLVATKPVYEQEDKGNGLMNAFEKMKDAAVEAASKLVKGDNERKVQKKFIDAVNSMSDYRQKPVYVELVGDEDKEVFLEAGYKVEETFGEDQLKVAKFKNCDLKHNIYILLRKK